MEKNLIQVNGGTTINVDVGVKNEKSYKVIKKIFMKSHTKIFLFTTLDMWR